MAINKQASISIKIDGANAAKQDVEGIRTAFEKLGDTGKAAATPIINALQNIEKADEKVTNKISQGRAITVKDGSVMLQQFEYLKEEIDKAFGSIANAPADIQTAFAKAEVQFKHTTQTVAKMTDAVGDQREQLKEGGIAWTGFGDTLNKWLGTAGGVQVQFLALVAALKAGWAVGQQINDTIGTNKTAMDAATGTWKDAAKSVTDALTKDGAIAAIQQYVVAAKGWMTNLGDTGQALKAQGILIEAGVPRWKAYSLAQKEATDIIAVYNLALQGGQQGLKAWNDTVAEAAKDPAKFGAYLDAQKIRFEGLAKATKEAENRTKDYKAAIDTIIAGYDGEIKKLELLKIARDRNLKDVNNEISAEEAHIKAQIAESDATTALLHAHAPLPLAFDDELKRIKELIPNYEQNQASIKAYSEELKTDYSLYEGQIDPSRQKQIARLIEMLGKYGELDSAGQQQVQADLDQLNAREQLGQAIGGVTLKMVDGKQVMTNVITDTKELTIKQDALTGVISNTGSAVDTVAVKWDHGKASIVSTKAASEDLALRVIDLDKSIAGNITALEVWIKTLEATATALLKVKQAAAEAAGSQSNVPLPKSSAPSPQDFTPSGPDMAA